MTIVSFVQIRKKHRMHDTSRFCYIGVEFEEGRNNIDLVIRNSYFAYADLVRSMQLISVFVFAP